MMKDRPKGKQGFASLTPERRKEIAAMGGRRAQALGVCHRWTSGAEASEAGRKGGRISRRGPVKDGGA